jgi:pimeloyl-ACP methyl ester carboxylesterase
MKKKALIILHGLCQHQHDFSTSIQKLHDAFTKQHMFVSIEILKEAQTCEKAITQQAADAFGLLQEQYANREHEFILLGHSQGGVRAAKLLELNSKHLRPLDIKGLITTATPWQGLPAAAITKQKVKEYLKHLPWNYFLAGMKYFHLAKIPFDETFIDRWFDERLPISSPGVNDLVPGSKFLQDISAFLSVNELPILAIAGNTSDVRKIFIDKQIPVRFGWFAYPLRMLPLNTAYKYIIGGGFLQEHDMLVPLASQIAKDIPQKKNFTSFIVQDAIHDFIPGLDILPNQVIYSNPVTIQQIVKFAQQNFS